MRILIGLIIIMLVPGCFSVYDIAPGAIVQYNNTSAPPVANPDGTRALTMPDDMVDGGDNQTAMGDGGYQNVVNIGGKSSAATDLVATIEAQIRDLFATPIP